MAKYITRTITTATVVTYAVNPLEVDKGVVKEQIVVENPSTNKVGLIKSVKEHIEKAGMVFIATEGEPIFTEQVYGITVEDFMRLAVKIERPVSQQKKAVQ